jgi:Lipocalin-like domain
MFWRTVFIAGAFMLSQASVADDRDRITGLWKLVSFDVEYQDTNERKPTYGAKPGGYLVILAEGRMMAVITAEGRKVPKTDEDRLAALRTMLAYSGRYRIEGDKWITKVDVAWNEAWTGTEQTRTFRFDGPRLQVLSPWQPSANEPGRTIRGILVWEREK